MPFRRAVPAGWPFRQGRHGRQRRRPSAGTRLIPVSWSNIAAPPAGWRISVSIPTPSPSRTSSAWVSARNRPSPSTTTAPPGGVSAGGAAPSSPEAADPVASLEKQLRAVQSASAKKIHELQTSLAAAETARDQAQAQLAELTQRVARLGAALETERTARQELVGGVTAPESDHETPAGATPHLDAYAALRSLDERRAYADAHRAELAAERARIRR